MTPTVAAGGCGPSLGRACSECSGDQWGLEGFAEAVDLGGSSSLNLLVGEADRRYVVRVHRPYVTLGGNIIETGTDSYRLARTRAFTTA